MAALMAADPAKLNDQERRWRREARAGWLRLGIALILLVNLAVGETQADLRVHSQVAAGYALVTVAAVALPLLGRGPRWLSTLLIVGDALLVLMLFHEHLFATVPHLDHSLTAPSIAVSFLLLSHAALWLTPRLVVLFASLVLGGWLSLAAALAAGSMQDALAVLAPDLALALAFTFAAFIVYLLTDDHVRLMHGAIATERRRANLSRFFSPGVASELEARGDTLGLRRHDAAVMFVDLRAFTEFAERAAPLQLATTLSEYRQLVSDVVFEWGGTIDKFVGDGVLALFGVPNPSRDDARRALACAQEIARVLAQWRDDRLRRGEPAFETGIGVHFGPVISGVLASGRHDEFTALGDTVNIAERLERCAKAFRASLVISEDLITQIDRPHERETWERHTVALAGRSRPFAVVVQSDVAFADGDVDMAPEAQRSCPPSGSADVQQAAL